MHGSMLGAAPPPPPWYWMRDPPAGTQYHRPCSRHAQCSIHRLHYFRIPKTGSSLSKTIFQEMACGNLTVHDHGDGCPDLQWCNGSEWSARSFVVVREPVERFISQFEHMHQVARGKHKDMRAKLSEPRYFLSWLLAATAACGSGTRATVECDVAALNAAYHRLTHEAVEHTHRVILWPQAFFTPRGAHVLCYSRFALAGRLSAYLSSGLGASCAHTFDATLGERRINDRHANATSDPTSQLMASMTPSQRSAIRTRLYPNDAKLWSTHCAKEPMWPK